MTQGGTIKQPKKKKEKKKEAKGYDTCICLMQIK